MRKFAQQIRHAFVREKSDLELARKIILSKIVFKIRYSRQKRFGLFLIFGWRQKWNKLYADIPDSSQDIFAKKERNIFKETSLRKIVLTLNFDGAILVDSRGTILHSGIVIEGLKPRLLAAKKFPYMEGDLSSRLGFKRKVHTRHLSAIAASWEFKGTTIFTVSEETGDIHVFEKGRIIFSTVPGEVVVKS